MGKEGPRGLTRDGFKRASLGKEGPKDRLEMSREPTWAKKSQRID